MGGGGGQTQQKDQYSSISPWAQPYVTSMLGAAQQQVFNTDASGNITGINPYTAYGFQGAGMSPDQLQAAQSSVAGFSPLQQQAFQGAGNLQTPGQFGQATGAAGLGTLQSLTAGNRYNQMATNPNAVGAFMNPYIQQSLQPQLNEIQRQGDIASNQARSQATSAGAFGGTRSALASNEAQRNAMLAQQNAIAQGYNTAFNNAQQNMQYGANLGLQGAQAGIAGAGQLGQLGTAQLGAQQGILGMQNQFGQQQQQQNQNVINQAMQNYQTAQQYPMQQLGQLKSMVTGLPITDTTSTLQQAGPNTGSQLAGLGAVATGIGSSPTPITAKEGGIMKAKRFDVGGSVIDKLDDMDDTSLAEEAKTSESETIRQEAARIMAERKAYEGLTGLKSNLAFSDGGILNFQGQNTDDAEHEYAGGGIIALAEGGTFDVARNVLDLMKNPEYAAYGQPDEERQALLQEIKDAKTKAAATGDNFLSRALIAGGAKAMSGLSPYGMVNLGEGITGGLNQYTAEEKNMQDQLNKLRQGQLDLSKLSAEDRRNLLHYATSAAQTQEQADTRAQVAKDAAAMRRTLSGNSAGDRTFNAKLGAFNNAYSKIIKAMEDKIGIDKMTDDDYALARERAIEAANSFIESAKGSGGSGGSGGKGDSGGGKGKVVDYKNLPK